MMDFDIKKKVLKELMSVLSNGKVSEALEGQKPVAVEVTKVEKAEPEEDYEGIDIEALKPLKEKLASGMSMSDEMDEEEEDEEEIDKEALASLRKKYRG